MDTTSRLTSRLRLAFYLLAFPCLSAWILVRLWVALTGIVPGKLLLAAALAAAAGILWGFSRFFRAFPKFTEPFLRPSPRLLIPSVAFLLGGLFDVSYAMRNMDGTAVTHPAVRILCHLGNAFVFLVIVVLLYGALRDMKGLGRVSGREMAVLFVLFNALTVLYVLTSRTVYYWDVAGYWVVARNLSAQPLSYGLLRQVLESTIRLDYNYLLAFPISLVMRVLGGSRAVFLFTTVNLYALPCAWGLCALAKGRRGGGLMLCALFSMVLYTALVGFVDVAACALAIWAVVVYLSDREPVSRGILTGALLVGSFLLRRYFFFFAASFGVAALVKTLVFHRRQWREFLSLFLSCAVCGLTFTYRFLLEKVLASNYGDLYSAYDLGLGVDVGLLGRYFGVILLAVLLVGGAVQLVRSKTPDDRSPILFSLCQIIVCFVAFVLIQSHGQQHLLLYVPCLAALAAASPLFRSKAPWCAVLSGVILANSFIPVTLSPLAKRGLPSLLPTFTYYGPRRTDIDQLLALDDYLNSLSEGGTKAASVCASSFLLNCETMMYLRPSLNLPEASPAIRYYYVASVDKRDQFSWNMLDADYVVVGDPVQVHLGEENQQIVALPAHAILDGTGLGAAYERQDVSFTLSDGSQVYVYRRVREVTPEERQALSQALQTRYPNYAQLYQLP